MFTKVAAAVVSEFIDTAKEWHLDLIADFQPDLWSNRGQDIRLTDQDSTDKKTNTNVLRYSIGTPRRVDDKLRNVPLSLYIPGEVGADEPTEKEIIYSTNAYRLTQSWNDTTTQSTSRSAVLLEIPMSMTIASEDLFVVEDALMIIYTRFTAPQEINVPFKLGGDDTDYEIPYVIKFEVDSSDLRIATLQDSPRFHELSLELTVHGFFFPSVVTTAGYVEEVNIVISESSDLTNFATRTLTNITPFPKGSLMFNGQSLVFAGKYLIFPT